MKTDITEPMSTSARPMPSPDGITLRRFAGDADLRAFVGIFTAANRADGIDERVSFEALANWVAHPSPHFDAARDVVVAVAGDRPIGYGWASWVDTSDGVREYVSRGHVHGEWRRRGIGTAILRHNEAHLRRVLATFVDHYHHARPHQGLGQRTPVAPAAPPGCGPLRRRDRLGGLLRDYYREAA